MSAPFAVWVLASVLAQPAPETPRVSTEVRATVADDLHTIDLVTNTRWSAVSSMSEVTIVLAAERYRRAPPHVSHQVRELFPGEFDEGGFDLVELSVDGRPCQPSRSAMSDGGTLLSCPVQVAAGGTVQVSARATLHVPERFGPFGRFHRSLTLAGAWYPYVARPSAAPPRGALHVEVSIPASMVAVLSERWFPVGGSTGRRTISVRAEDRAQVPLILRPASHRAISIAGGRARLLTGPGSATQDVEARPTEISELVSAIEDGLRYWDEAGLTGPTPARPLVVVHAPLRHDLARAVDGIVLVSDHAFRMFPADRFLRFHRLPILRECFQQLIDRGLGGRGGPEERWLAADALGAWMLDRYAGERFGKKEDAFDLLTPFAFIPSIDSMLYAPDLPFVGAYFRLIREEDPLRSDFVIYPSPRPRGKILYEKLVDRVGPPSVDRVFTHVLDGGRFFASLAELLGPDFDEVVTAWLGPYPDVQYRLVEWNSTDRPDLCPRCVEARAVIERSGETVAEPIQVRFSDDDGHRVVRVAEASAAVRRVVTATLTAPLDLVEIDPFGRLAEASTAEVPAPRFDNRSKHRWRVLLNSWNLQLAATAGTINTSVDVGFARRYDNAWGFALRFDFRPDAITGTGRGTYGFGRAVTPNKLSQWIGLSVSAGYLRPGFADQVEDGIAGAATLFYGYDDRISPWAPETATALRASLGYNHVFGTPPEGSTEDAAGLSLRFLQQVQVGLRHQLSLRASAGAYFYGEPRDQLLFAIGGRTNVRGYAVDDEVGRLRGIASLEWLHPLMPRWEDTGFFIAWVNGMDGAFFGDVAVIGDSFEALGQKPVLADVGYGLRIYIDYFGVRPGVMAIDVAFPLVKTEGMQEIGPPAVYIDFTQSFLVF